MTARLIVPAVCSLICAATCPTISTGQDYQPRTVLPRPIRAITDPPILSAADANVDENELVIGVVVDDKARAYPINQLTGPRREIINDVLAGTAIAATW